MLPLLSIVAVVGVIGLVGLVITCLAAARAPQGYEDATGFHYGHRPE